MEKRSLEGPASRTVESGVNSPTKAIMHVHGYRRAGRTDNRNTLRAFVPNADGGLPVMCLSYVTKLAVERGCSRISVRE